MPIHRLVAMIAVMIRLSKCKLSTSNSAEYSVSAVVRFSQYYDCCCCYFYGTSE